MIWELVKFMYLVIDNTHLGRLFFYTLAGSALNWSAQVSFELDADRPLLSYLDDFLHQQNLGRDSLQGLIVVTGSGSFTAARVAVTVANVIAFGWQVPVATVLEAVPQRVLEAMRQALVGTYVSAKYSGAAHIGGVKKIPC